MGDVYTHRPVLLEAVIEGLRIKSRGAYVDCTFGRGGHAQAILRELGLEGRLLAIDKDPQAVQAARERFASDRRFIIARGTFAMLKQHMQNQNLYKADGILLDLGVSSPQIEDAGRGFSFTREGPLDMRMDPEQPMSARQWLATAPEAEIGAVLRDYGEERYAKRIARAIARARAEAPIDTTRQLATIVAEANPAWEKGKDPATRSFQAIRIFINHELDELKACLPQTVEVLQPGGRLVVISFHSLEDRLIKRFIRDEVRGDKFPPGLPVTQAALRPRLRAVGKPVHPGADEIANNPRARSAVLRIAERLP